MTVRRGLAAFLVLLVLGSPAPRAAACGPDNVTLFVSPYAPDTEAARFVAGEVGVIQPTWARAYLVVSYRHLAGAPLTADEQASVLAYFRGRPQETVGLEAWKRSRETATGQPTPAIETEREAVSYDSYLNCGDDAFRRAATTLDAYVLKFGRTAAESSSWREAQDLVFANCGGTQARIPGPLPSSAPAALRHDRAYQIASANFYAGCLEAAQAGFDEIARDPDSRWKAIAPYLAGRAVLRRGTLADGPPIPAMLAEARARFASLVSSSASPDVRRWSSDLVRFVDVRLEPASHVPAAAWLVLSPPSPEAFGTAFVHYRDLLDRVLGSGRKPRGRGPKPGDYVPDPTDDLTSWIVAFQDPSPRGLERALAGFSRTHAAPWTLAVLARIGISASPSHSFPRFVTPDRLLKTTFLPASDPRATEVVEAARRLALSGPGQLQAAYHLARLATEAGRTAEARALVDANLPRAEAHGRSAKNLFLELKVRNAATFDEFAAAAPRRPAFSMNEDDQAFDDFTRDVLNRRLPLDALARFAEKAPLVPYAAAEMRRVVFTRALLLGRADVARRFAPPAGGKVAWDAPDWRVDGALAVLVEDSNSTPYVVIDPPMNIAWWCALPEPLPAGRECAFLSPDERRAAAGETERLGNVPPAATWFTREALQFAKRHPDDPRAPEFLARAVRATRKGCKDAETRALSKAAFEHLHRRYPKSPFAKQTKYWFEGRGWRYWFEGRGSQPPVPAGTAPPS